MHTINPNSDKMLTTREAADFLNISERTVWQLAKDNRIPHVRIGKLVRFDPQDLRAWLATMKQGPTNPPAPLSRNGALPTLRGS